MAKIKQSLDTEQVAKIVADAIAARDAAKPKFLSPKSTGLWVAIGAIIVYAFTIFGNISGCFQSKYDKERSLQSAVDGVTRLDRGDSVLQKQLIQNYWYFIGLHKQDSTYAAIWQDHFMDSLGDHRAAINLKRDKK